MALQRTMTYYGTDEDGAGMPIPWFHYLVIASPGAKEGSATVSIMPLSESRAKGIAQEPSHTMIAKVDGPEAALKMAEEFLDKEHPGLKKIVSDLRAK